LHHISWFICADTTDTADTADTSELFLAHICLLAPAGATSAASRPHLLPMIFCHIAIALP
jgi:hypothetical protein